MTNAHVERVPFGNSNNTLHVERSGSGRTVLFINGSGTTLDGSRLLLKNFTENFDLIAFDHRGMGKSDMLPGPWTMADYAADVRGILDFFDVKQCAVLGVSFGGMVALEVAVTFPELVQRLCLWCTSAGGAAGSSYPLELLDLLSGDEEVDYRRLVLDRRFTKGHLEASPIDQLIAAHMLAGAAERRAKGDDLAYQEQMQARRHHDVADRLSNIIAPTLLQMGRFDGIAPLANGEAIAARVRTSELRSYDGGHGFFAQDSRAIPDAKAFISA